MVSFLLVLLAALSVTIVIHELGHIIAIKGHGYRVTAVLIGWPVEPLIEIVIKKDFAIYLSPWLIAAGTIADIKRRPRKLVWLKIVLAGPLANLLAALTAYAGHLLGTRLAMVYESGFLTNLTGFLEILIFFNLLLGLSNLLPIFSGDGDELWKLVTGRYVEGEEC